MSFSYPLDLPSNAYTKTTISAETTVGESRSPYDLSEQLYEHDGELWHADLSIHPMQRDEAEAWISILLALRGPLFTFLLGDSAGKNPLGTQTANVAVNGGGQTGHTLAIDGVTGQPKRGDWIQIVGGSVQRLHKIIKTPTVVTGGCTLDIWPRLREIPSDDAVVVFVNARGTFRKVGNMQSWDTDTAMIKGISFQAIEAINT